MRYLRFSLRALLLVVTGISVWLGWEWRIAHERREVRRLIEDMGGSIEPAIGCGFGNPTLFDLDQSESISWVRRCLGDESLANHLIFFSLDDDSLHESRISAAFPEAQLVCLQNLNEWRQLTKSRNQDP